MVITTKETVNVRVELKQRNMRGPNFCSVPIPTLLGMSKAITVHA